MTSEEQEVLVRLITEEKYAEVSTLLSSLAAGTDLTSRTAIADALLLTQTALLQVKMRKAHYEVESQQLSSLRTYLASENVQSCLNMIG